MISELILTSLLLLNNAADNNGQHFLNAEDGLIEIDSLKTDYSRTFKTDYGSYITFVTGDDETSRTVNDRSNESNTSVIQNKYIVIGDSSSYNGTTLNVGQSSLYNVNGDSTIYKIVFNIDLSVLPSDSYVIANAGIRMYKNSGNLDSLYCYKVNNLSYSQINGNSNLNTTYVDSSSVNTSGLFNYFDFDCTSEIVAANDNGSNYIKFLFEGHESNKQSTIYSKTSIRKPVFYFEYYSRYGCAPTFESLQCLTGSNCFGFVLKQNIDYNINSIFVNDLGDTVINANVMRTTVFDLIKNCTGPYYTRLLDSYDSYINDNERRIACRLKLADNSRYDGDYHFVCQCDDGSWAAKNGTAGYIVQFFGDDAPATDYTVWNWLDGHYNSPTLYFAYQL